MSISALLISIYPHFPNSPNDNKCHLQALRHFYVLAVEHKVFEAIDVETGKSATLNLEMEFSLYEKLSIERHTMPILL
jgi:anaphase-promoting complex subunit 1